MRLKKWIPILLACLLLTACGRDSVAEISGIRESKRITLEDSHGGFHGDGDTIAIYQADSFEPDQDWKALPLPQELSIALYGGKIGEMEWNSLFLDEKGEPRMPQVENGYYYFQDRHSESTDPADYSQLLSRSSLNFTLAVYDADSELIYYFEKDT